MIKYLLILVSIPIFVFSMKAEEDSLSKFALGPYLAMKGGINAGSVLKGRKNELAFSSVPEVGVSFNYKLNSQNHTAILFDLGYSGYSFGIQDASNGKIYTEDFSYLCIAPGFRYSVLTFNIIFGIPVNADYGPEISTSVLNVITAVQLGVDLPLYSDLTGSLDLFIKADYMLSGIFKEFSKNDPLHKDVPSPYLQYDSYNPRAASLQVGISYLFNF